MTGHRQTLAAVLQTAASRLRDAGIDGAVSESRILLTAAAGLSREDILRDPDTPLTAAVVDAFVAMIDRRAAREPVSRILGRREFRSLEFRIGPATLDPRPDSETVVEAALQWAADRRDAVRVLDLGTGSGCLLLAILKDLPAARGVGTDINGEAVACARRNAAALELSRRAEFIETSWTDGVGGMFDIVVSNPPYIPTGDIAELEPEVASYDPPAALDGGPDGLEAYRAISTCCSALLVADGVVVVETGAGQADDVSAIFHARGFDLAETRHDLAGRPRALVFSPVAGSNG